MVNTKYSSTSWAPQHRRKSVSSQIIPQKYFIKVQVSKLGQGDRLIWLAKVPQSILLPPVEVRPSWTRIDERKDIREPQLPEDASVLSFVRFPSSGLGATFLVELERKCYFMNCFTKKSAHFQLAIVVRTASWQTWRWVRTYDNTAGRSLLPQNVNLSPYCWFPFGVVNFDEVLAKLHLNNGCQIPAYLNKERF